MRRCESSCFGTVSTLTLQRKRMNLRTCRLYFATVINDFKMWQRRTPDKIDSVLMNLSLGSSEYSQTESKPSTKGKLCSYCSLVFSVSIEKCWEKQWSFTSSSFAVLFAVLLTLLAHFNQFSGHTAFERAQKGTWCWSFHWHELFVHRRANGTATQVCCNTKNKMKRSGILVSDEMFEANKC